LLFEMSFGDPIDKVAFINKLRKYALNPDMTADDFNNLIYG